MLLSNNYTYMKRSWNITWNHSGNLGEKFAVYITVLVTQCHLCISHCILWQHQDHLISTRSYNSFQSNFKNFNKNFSVLLQYIIYNIYFSFQTFIYNQNKKERVKTDIKTVHVRRVVGSFQSYQRRYAKSCKLCKNF